MHMTVKTRARWNRTKSPVAPLVEFNVLLGKVNFLVVVESEVGLVFLFVNKFSAHHSPCWV